MPPKRLGSAMPHAKDSKKYIQFRNQRLMAKMKEQSAKMRLQSQLIRSIKSRAATISAASDIVEKISSRDLILRKADQKKIVKMGQKADLIIKTIDDYKAKIDYINSGRAAIDEWKKQRAAEEQQEREEKENQEAASRGEAPPARKRPAGATDYPLAAGYVPKYLRKNQPLFSEPLFSDSD